MAINMSLDAKLYRGAAGSTASTEVNTCKDVSLKIKKGEAKISSRASRWALVKGAMKEAEFDVEFNSDANDVHLQALLPRLFPTRRWPSRSPTRRPQNPPARRHRLHADRTLGPLERGKGIVCLRH